MAKITLHITPVDAHELTAITAVLATFVSPGAPAAAEQPAPAAAEQPAPAAAEQPAPAAAEQPAPAAAEEAPKTKRRAPRKSKPAKEPAPVPPTEPDHSTEQTSGGGPGSREALVDAMRSALTAGKRAEVTQVLREFGATRATELKDEDVAAATAMVVAL